MNTFKDTIEKFSTDLKALRDLFDFSNYIEKEIKKAFIDNLPNLLPIFLSHLKKEIQEGKNKRKGIDILNRAEFEFKKYFNGAAKISAACCRDG